VCVRFVVVLFPQFDCVVNRCVNGMYDFSDGYVCMKIFYVKCSTVCIQVCIGTV
jgi:hypothetical protein